MSRMHAEAIALNDLAQAPATHVDEHGGPRRPRPDWVGRHRPRDLHGFDLERHLAGLVPHRHRRALLVELARYAAMYGVRDPATNKRVGVACGRQTTYAKLIRKTDRTVRTYMRALERDDLIWTVDRQGTHWVYVNWEALGLQHVAPVFSGLNEPRGPRAFAGRTGKTSGASLKRSDPIRQQSAADPTTLPTPKPTRRRPTPPRVNTVHPADPTVTAVHITAPVEPTAERGREAGDGARTPAPPAEPGGQLLAPAPVDYGMVPAPTADPPPVDVPASLLVAILDAHGRDALDDVRDVLAGDVARRHPDAARLAVQRTAQLPAAEVKRSAGAFMTSALRLAIAGKLRSHNTRVADHAMKRITDAIDEFVQTGRSDDAARMREMARIESMKKARERELLLLQDPDVQRVERMKIAASDPSFLLPRTYTPQPRELAPRAPSGVERYLASKFGDPGAS